MKLDGLFVATIVSGNASLEADGPGEWDDYLAYFFPDASGFQQAIVHNVELADVGSLYYARLFLVSGTKISVPLMPGVQIEGAQHDLPLDDIDSAPSELTFAMPTGDEFVLRGLSPSWQLDRFLTGWGDFGGPIPASSQTYSGALLIQRFEVYEALGEKCLALKTISGDTVVNRFDTEDVLEYAFDDESGMDIGMAASEPSNPDAEFHYSLEGRKVIELRRVYGHQLDEIVGFDADFSDSLIDLVLGHLACNPIGSLGLPIPEHSLRVDALFVEGSDTENWHCVGVELWVDSHGEADPANVSRLVALRGLEGWTANDCDLLYKACLESGISDPETLDVERLSIRPHWLSTFIRLFDRLGESLSWEDGKLFGEPPDLIVSRGELPSQLFSLLISSLEIPRSEWESYGFPDIPFGRGLKEEPSSWEVLEGVLKTGLFARLDTLVDLIHRLAYFAPFREDHRPETPGEPWVTLERILRKRLNWGQRVEVVWQSRLERVLHRLRFEFDEQSVSVLAEVLSPEQTYDGWDWEPISIDSLGTDSNEVWEELTTHLNFSYLEHLAFELEFAEDGDDYRGVLDHNGFLSLRRSCSGTLAPELAAQVITRVLQGKPDSSSNFEVFIDESRLHRGWQRVWFDDGLERNRQRFEEWLELTPEG